MIQLCVFITGQRPTAPHHGCNTLFAASKCSAIHCVDTEEWCRFLFSFKYIILNSNWITKKYILRKLETIHQTQKAYKIPWKHTQVGWTKVGEKSFALGILPRLWVPVVSTSWNDGHRSISQCLNVLFCFVLIINSWQLPGKDPKGRGILPKQTFHFSIIYITSYLTKAFPPPCPITQNKHTTALLDDQRQSAEE